MSLRNAAMPDSKSERLVTGFQWLIGEDETTMPSRIGAESGDNARRKMLRERQRHHAFGGMRGFRRFEESVLGLRRTHK